MSLGRRAGESQQPMWIATSRIAEAPGHPFYRELNHRLAGAGLRTYVPERREGRRRRWTDKPPEWEKAHRGNRRRVPRRRGKALQRSRSGVVERSFAQVCETGGARRTWIRGILAVSIPCPAATVSPVQDPTSSTGE